MLDYARLNVTCETNYDNRQIFCNYDKYYKMSVT